MKKLKGKKIVEKFIKTEDIKTEDVKTDYATYNMGLPEHILYIIVAALALFLIGYIFYRSVLFSILLSLFSMLFPKYRKEQIIKNRKRKLNLQFKDMLYSLSSAIGAGNSVEHSIEITKNDLEQQYGDSNTFIIKELEYMVSKLSLNQNIEDVFNDFANRSSLEDVKTFANIFEISKRTGGNLIDIIRQTSNTITEKIEVKTEIETLLAGHKSEQKVLTAVPVLLIFFMTETTEGFMDPIFNTIGGRIVATIALVMVFIGYMWSKKIADIEI